MDWLLRLDSNQQPSGQQAEKTPLAALCRPLPAFAAANGQEKGNVPDATQRKPAGVNRTTHADGNTRFALALSRGLFLLITAT
jgi:hypothetical protein